jgi:hypothetical protein
VCVCVCVGLNPLEERQSVSKGNLFWGCEDVELVRILVDCHALILVMLNSIFLLLQGQ